MRGLFPIVVHYPFATVYIHASYTFVEFFMDIEQPKEVKVGQRMKAIGDSWQLKKFDTILEDKIFNDAMRASYSGGGKQGLTGF
jgi:hypothetical protein